ncbi:MAG: hypothetical protein GF409_05855 [Candidatus Omnitrophica bacterium]|nr:hypothetical protein [Candidatus Omnitrophota bacterium]
MLRKATGCAGSAGPQIPTPRRCAVNVTDPGPTDRMDMDKERFFEFAFGCTGGGMTESVIITPFLSPDKFTRGGDVVGSFRGRLYSGVRAKKAGVEYTVIRSGMGNRLLGDAVLLLEASPVETVLFAGTCGGFGDAGIGDIVLCDKAFDGEGFSQYYRKGRAREDILASGQYVQADPGVYQRLKKHLTGHTPGKLILGDIFTIGSVVAEESRFVKNIERKGFSGIEMELSAVYTASNAAGIKAAALAVVSDLPLERPLWGLTAEQKRQCAKSMDQMAELLSDFILKDSEN